MLPSKLERDVFRLSPEFSKWHAEWTNSRKKGGALNTKKYLGDISLLLLLEIKPSSLLEWERAFVSYMGCTALIEHAQLFSVRTSFKLAVEDALKIILIHAVDETWRGWQARLAAREALTARTAEAHVVSTHPSSSAHTRMNCCARSHGRRQWR